MYVTMIRCALIGGLIISFASQTQGYALKAMNKRALEAPDVPPRSNSRTNARAFDLTPVSFQDIEHRRFRPTESTSSRMSLIVEGDKDPNTFLFSDEMEVGWGPIVDLTQPRAFRTLNALLHRYQNLHIYYTSPSGTVKSRFIQLRRTPRTGLLTAPGTIIEGLDKRIRDIEHIKQNYGPLVAQARFHRHFQPIDQVAVSNYGRVMPTWADIVASNYIPIFGDSPVAIRQHLESHRMGKFLSFDGRHLLGIRVNPQGIADHYEVALHQVHP